MHPPGMEDLPTDALFVVPVLAGSATTVHLPVHSQVVGRESETLRGMFASAPLGTKVRGDALLGGDA